jgi:hypothetical protein
LLWRGSRDGVGLAIDGLARNGRTILFLFVATAEWPPALCRGHLGNEDEADRYRRQGKQKPANGSSH